MSDQQMLNEHIKAQRNALIATAIVSLVVFVSSLDRISVGKTIGIYDRFLIEYFILENTNRFPYEIGDPINSFSEKELGISKMSVFKKISHFRYALPNAFHDSVCRAGDGLKAIEAGWKIGIDLESECKTYDINAYKYPKDKRRELNPIACKNQSRGCFPMPSHMYIGEDWEAFDEQDFLSDLIDGLEIKPETLQLLCQQCEGKPRCVPNAKVEKNEIQNLSQEEELEGLQENEKLIEDDEFYSKEAAYLVESCNPIRTLNLDTYGYREHHESLLRMQYQTKGAKPARIVLVLQHDSGVVGMEFDELILANEDYYVSSSNGCNYQPGDFSIDTNTLPKPNETDDPWDCYGQSSSKDLIFITQSLDNIIALREGVDFAPGRERDYKFYRGYLNVLESEFKKDVGIPYLPINAEANWVLYTGYVINFFLLAWLLYLQRAVQSIGVLQPTVPWLLWVLRDHMMEENATHRFLSLIVGVIPLTLVRFIGYFMPGVLLLVLVFLAVDGRMEGTRLVPTVDVAFGLVIGSACLVSGCILASLEIKLIRRIRRAFEQSDKSKGG